MTTIDELVSATFAETGVVVPPSQASAAYALWLKRARPNQIAPHANHPLESMRRDDWLIWYIRAGRGWGKTLTGAEWLAKESERSPHVAIVAEDFGKGRDVCVEGESGLLAVLPDLDWNRSLGEMTFPSGAKGKLYSAEKPRQLRGPNNSAAWCDEFSSWRYQRETWDQLMFTMRKGQARVVITTTPKPSKLSTALQAKPTTVVTWGTTYENEDNLSAAFFDTIIKPYEGTTLGKQELEAKELDDVPGALWKRENIDDNRCAMPSLDDIVRIVIALDPATTSNEDSDETGIIAAALGRNGHGYILEDKSLRGSPLEWANEAVKSYTMLRADMVVAEANNGGEMVAQTLRTVESSLPITLVHASRGKLTRAEPISALYERNLVHHVGTFPQLEDQMCTWLPGDADSPDRMDALVWALTALMIGHQTVESDSAPAILSSHRG